MQGTTRLPVKDDYLSLSWAAYRVMFTTHPIHIWQAALVLRGLDERREPFLLVPVPELVTRHLAKAHDDRVYIRDFRNVKKYVLNDPLRLGVATPKRRLGINQRHFGHRWR